jgi:hypothetical protein
LWSPELFACEPFCALAPPVRLEPVSERPELELGTDRAVPDEFGQLVQVGVVGAVGRASLRPFAASMPHSAHSAARAYNRPEAFERGLVIRAAERLEGRYDDCGGVEPRACLVQPTCEPACRVAATAIPIPERDEGGQFERLVQVELSDVARLDLSDNEVAALKCPPECGSCVTVIAQDAPVLGTDSREPTRSEALRTDG